MRVIGDPELKYDKSGDLLNPQYKGGQIVELTKNECQILAELNSLWKTEAKSDPWYDFVTGDYVYSIADAFKAVHLFLESKAAIAKIKEVNELLGAVFSE